MTVETAGTLGYCHGVRQAIESAEKFTKERGPVTSLGTLAHNGHVVEHLRQEGVVPIESLDWDTLNGVIITAHGAPPKIFEHLKKLGVTYLDCTCPIVRKAQEVVHDLARNNFQIIIYGDPQHQEVQGLIGWAAGQEKFIGDFRALFSFDQEFKALNLGAKIGIVSQTTKIPEKYADFVSTLTYRVLGVPEEGALKCHDLRVFNTICPIVAERVSQARELAEKVDIMYVVGSRDSANTMNLFNEAKAKMIHRIYGTCVLGDSGSVPIYIVEDATYLPQRLIPYKFTHEKNREFTIGVTAGTSTPIEVVNEVVTKLKELTDEREDDTEH
jgi:(E)-4-hydroxy-3-methyl-but-2-enyl pyrophosphate reductase